MKLRKLTAMALASCMVLSMAACGGSKPAETTAAPTEAATTAAPETTAEAATTAAEEAATTAAEAAGGADLSNVKVGVSIYQFADNFMTLYRQELERYLVEELGVS